LPAALDGVLVEGSFKGAAGALALNTVVHRLSVLSKAHQIKDLANPARDPGGSGTLAPGAPGVCLSGRAPHAQNRAYQRPA
jgi:hypothetical protein